MPAIVERTGSFEGLRKALSAFRTEGVERAFVESAERILRAHRDELMPARRREPLSRAERAALLSVGVDPDAETADLSPVFNPVAMHAALAATAIPLKDAAARLGVDPSRLRQRLRDRSLLGVRLADGRSWGIPAFQFIEDGELPGLRPVLRALRADLRPVQVFAFFTTPQPDLEDGKGGPMTPRDWLLAGGEPGIVAQLAQDV